MLGYPPFVNVSLTDGHSAFLQASTSVSFYQLAPGLDVTLFGTLPDVASAAKVHGSLHFGLSLVPCTNVSVEQSVISTKELLPKSLGP